MKEKRNNDNRRKTDDRRKTVGRRIEDTVYPKDKTQLRGWVFSAIHNLLNRFGMTIDEFKKYVDEYIEGNYE